MDREFDFDDTVSHGWRANMQATGVRFSYLVKEEA